MSFTVIPDTAFDEAWWASQPLAVQQLRNTPADKRPALAAQLVAEGYSISEPIMLWGASPSEVMAEATEAGWQWLPDLTKPSLAALGTLMKEGPMPAGAFKVSENIADFPPVPQPPPAPPPQPSGVASWVGDPVAGLLTPDGLPWYRVSHSGCPLLNGQIYKDDPRGIFKYYAMGPFVMYFGLVSSSPATT